MLQLLQCSSCWELVRHAALFVLFGRVVAGWLVCGLWLSQEYGASTVARVVSAAGAKGWKCSC
jgi:hypothetical protein